MQTRFVKDLAIGLVVIVLLVLVGYLVVINRDLHKIPVNSVYSRESVSDSLMSQIRNIENSIQDRKVFVFTTKKDPLRQGNIIKDKADRIQEYEEMLRNLFRLATVAIDEHGNKIALIEYQDALHSAREGETVAGRKIIEIKDKSIRYSMGGNTYTANLMARPEIPDENQYQKKGMSGNW
ncbi:MAG: hypothetical protein LHW60_04355 [Candidatus Cloacimonetes bacterium]|mgnify:CR=1 FL=1|jgi:hypothetical protein|nr:hypothetical protein [Candidatus Cloacimonadota bacterium]NLO43790.1 hypothetical protein [Candidatus Cloacimonadota bacterium]